MGEDEVFSAIAGKLVSDRGFVDVVASWGGPSTEDWQDTPARRIAAEAYRLYTTEQRSFEYVRWQLLKTSDYELVTQVHRRDLPNDNEAIRRLLKEAVHKRRAFNFAAAVMKKPEDIDRLMHAYQVRGEIGGTGTINARTNICEQFGDYDKAVREKKSVIVIRHFERLSDLIGGFNGSRLAICNATTGTGKTSLALNIMLAAAKTMRIFYVNMEMALKDVSERIAAISLGKSFAELRRTGIGDQGQRVQLALGTNDLFISNGRDRSIHEIKGEARSYAKKEKLDLVIIDYDQKLTLDVSRDTPEWKALQLAMVSLEDLAKELDCFVLVLAQSNREGEISGSFRSQFPASSVWGFVYDEELQKHCIEFSKNRFGPIHKRLIFDFQKECGRIAEMEVAVKPPKKKKRASYDD